MKPGCSRSRSHGHCPDTAVVAIESKKTGSRSREMYVAGGERGGKGSTDSKRYAEAQASRRESNNRAVSQKTTQGARPILGILLGLKPTGAKGTRVGEKAGTGLSKGAGFPLVLIKPGR